MEAATSSPTLSREDIVLGVAAGADGPYDLDPIRLMKGCFLVSQRGFADWRTHFHFEPYDYGPFDRGVYRARDELLARGLLVADSAGRRYPAYTLSEAGHQRMTEIAAEVGNEHADWLARIGRYVTSVSFARLLEQIYAAFPPYATRSVVPHQPLTVVVGFVGPDGAVMASDSEGTEGNHTRIDVEKCWTEGGLLLGQSGSSAVKQPLVEAIKSAVSAHFPEAEVDRWEGREALRRAAAPVLKNAYELFVPLTSGAEPLPLAGALLVIGRDATGYWLLEIDHNNTGTFYTDHGFHTIGSGGPSAYVAQGVMRHYELPGRTVPHLRLAAYRTVSTCISVMGGPMGVGGQVQLWSAQGGAAFSRALEEQCARIEGGLAQWTTIERESLDKVVVEGEVQAEAEEPDLPEDLEP